MEPRCCNCSIVYDSGAPSAPQRATFIALPLIKHLIKNLKLASKTLFCKLRLPHCCSSSCCCSYCPGVRRSRVIALVLLHYRLLYLSIAALAPHAAAAAAVVSRNEARIKQLSSSSSFLLPFPPSFLPPSFLHTASGATWTLNR